MSALHGHWPPHEPHSCAPTCPTKTHQLEFSRPSDGAGVRDGGCPRLRTVGSFRSGPSGCREGRYVCHSLGRAKAGVADSQASVEQAELKLGYTRVVSLVDGIAGINTVQVGNRVGPSTVLTAGSQVSPIKVYFPISEQEYLRMADGGGPGSVDFITHASRIPLQLTLADGRTYPHPGRIIFADRQVNTQTGTIQIVGEFLNSKNLLPPGQYARIQAPTGNITEPRSVPRPPSTHSKGPTQVTVVGADNRAQLRTLAVGPRVVTLWVITSGPKPGERVVVAGAEKAKEGELVNPTPNKETEER